MVNAMSAALLLGFVVGSSALVVLPFYWRVARLQDINYSYAHYTLVAPLYLGLMTALAVWLSSLVGLRRAVLGVSIASPLVVIAVARMTVSYNFTEQQWRAYGVRLVIKHMLMYNIVIYALLATLLPPITGNK